MKKWAGSLVLGWSLVIAAAAAADSNNDRIVVPLSDPTRPGTVRVNLLMGSITVTGYPGKEVLISPSADNRDEDQGADVDVHVRVGRDSDQPPTPRPSPAPRAAGSTPAPPAPPTPPAPPAPPASRHHHSDDESDGDDRARGLHRLPNASSGLSVDEDGNVVQVSSASWSNGVDLDIQVPVGTALQLATVNDGDILVRNVDGEINVENTNGDVTLRDVSGSVVAHALNGELRVVLQRVDPKKDMSFSSMNGNVDVTLPNDTKADVRIKSDNGEVYTDFDLQLGTRTVQKPESGDGDKSGMVKQSSKRHHYGYESAMYGSLNGGGPTLRFETFNGNIYIRKAK